MAYRISAFHQSELRDSVNLSVKCWSWCDGDELTRRDRSIEKMDRAVANGAIWEAPHDVDMTNSK